MKKKFLLTIIGIILITIPIIFLRKISLRSNKYFSYIGMAYPFSKIKTINQSEEKFYLVTFQHQSEIFSFLLEFNPFLHSSNSRQSKGFRILTIKQQPRQSLYPFRIRDESGIFFDDCKVSDLDCIRSEFLRYLQNTNFPDQNFDTLTLEDINLSETTFITIEAERKEPIKGKAKECGSHPVYFWIIEYKDRWYTYNDISRSITCPIYYRPIDMIVSIPSIIFPHNR